MNIKMKIKVSRNEKSKQLGNQTDWSFVFLILV